jgi:hypothetical protein
MSPRNLRTIAVPALLSTRGVAGLVKGSGLKGSINNSVGRRIQALGTNTSCIAFEVKALAISRLS